MIGPEHEAPREQRGEGFSDALTFAFGDPAAELYGVARVGLAAGDPPQASGLAILFAGREPVAVRADGGVEAPALDWSAAAPAGLRVEVVEPLERWSVSFEAQDGGFELELEARSAPAELPPGSDVALAGGMEGYEQLCAVTGTATVRGERRKVHCLGQRGHTWGTPDWERIELARTLGVWLGEDSGLMLTAVRPAGAAGHQAEALCAHLIEGTPPSVPAPVFGPRLSTGYDGELRQRRAGLELWVTGDEDEYPLRGAGEALCGTTLDLGRLRLDCAFFRWHVDGREGVGRYDVLRRA